MTITSINHHHYYYHHHHHLAGLLSEIKNFWTESQNLSFKLICLQMYPLFLLLSFVMTKRSTSTPKKQNTKNFGQDCRTVRIRSNCLKFMWLFLQPAAELGPHKYSNKKSGLKGRIITYFTTSNKNKNNNLWFCLCLRRCKCARNQSNKPILCHIHLCNYFSFNELSFSLWACLSTPHLLTNETA